MTRLATILPPALDPGELEAALDLAQYDDRDTLPPGGGEDVEGGEHDTWPDTVGFGGAW